MTEPKAREQDLHLGEAPVAWLAVPLAQALAAYPPGDEDNQVDAGWQAVHWQPDGAPANRIPRGTAVGQLARRLIALEQARLRQRAPSMAPKGRRSGVRAGQEP